MANYSNIKGFTVQTLSTDTVASQAEGGSWASGGSLNTGRKDGGGAGTQTAASMFFGRNPPSSTLVVHEYYNGTSWSEQADGNTPRGYGAGLGLTQTASLYAGGYAPSPGSLANVEVWDGSSWTEVNDINTQRENIINMSAGSTTAGLVYGGYAPSNPPSKATGKTEEWDGTNWTETGDLNNARYEGGGSGIQTAAIVSGGYQTVSPASRIVKSEQYNGSSWTEISNINTARTGLTAGGLYTSNLIFGGNASPGGGNSAKTEFWDGTSWTELSDLSAAKTLGNSGGGTTSSSSLYFGGESPAPAIVDTTEEWSAPAVFSKQVEGQLFFNSTANAFKETIQDIASGTWASGGTMNSARTNIGGMFAGNKTAGLIYGGREAPPAKVAYTESYDGSSWTEVNDLNTARHYGGGAGTSTAALCIGNSASPQTVVENWNGSSWTEISEINTGRGYWTCAGTSTDAIAANGYTTTMVNSNELWDGTSWTESGNTNSTADSRSSGGNTSAAIQAGGYITFSPPTNTTNTEIWNGSSWTEVNNLNQKERGAQGGGSSTQALACGGTADIPPFPSGLQTPVSSTEFWNGTTWTELNDLSTTKTEHGSRGNALNNLSAGGQVTNAASYTGVSEEWTAGLSNKTITSS